MSLVRNNQDNDINIYNRTNINSITLNTQAVKDNQVITKSSADQFHQKNERSRRELGINFFNEPNDSVKNNQDRNLNDYKLSNLDSMSAIGNLFSDNELTNKTYFDDSLGGGKILRFNQTLENYLNISVGNDVYNVIKFNKIQIIDTTIIKHPNQGRYLLRKWQIVCNDRNWNGKITIIQNQQNCLH